MELQIAVIPGPHHVDLAQLRTVAHEFGWTIQLARSIDELKDVAKKGHLGAVLFQHDSLDSGGQWLETITALSAALPEIRLVACSEFSAPVDYPKLCRAGLFYLVWLPLKRNEVRLCFGFIWEAEKRQLANSSRISRVIQMTRAAG